MDERYYRRDLALVHHRGFSSHAAACAPGILDLLAPIRAGEGLVLELGCGTGLLTTELIAAGHLVIATDASPAMLELAASHVGKGAEELRRLSLPDDPLPQVDAIVAVGHPINYLPDAEAVDRALIAIAALRPGGLVAIDICNLEWGKARRGALNFGRAGTDWAIITEFSVPSPDRFVRDMTTFLPDDNGSWRRDTEHHENVLVDTARVPGLLREHGVDACRFSVWRRDATRGSPGGDRAPGALSGPARYARSTRALRYRRASSDDWQRHARQPAALLRPPAPTPREGRTRCPPGRAGPPS